ncbi:DUF4145 domain-containing protein [Archangium gephyra]|uniref:DUF4145 domain-containing protein n=1 Tax=Archangium gephyra TaxID=48 RepID=UPI0035D440AB
MDDGGTFTASVKCSNCNTVIQAAGTWFNDLEVEEDENGNPVQRVAHFYSPKWLSHFPELIQTSPKFPDTIRAALRRADAAFWWDLRSCATALRHVVEIFLDDQGIPREGVKKSGDLRFRGLEERLQEFVEIFKRISEKDAEEFKDLLGATKLIGNEATHAAEPLTAETIELVSKFIGRVLGRRYTGDELLEAARRILASHQRSTVRPVEKHEDEGSKS